MLLDFTHVPNIFIVCGKTDLRKGIDGLAAFVTEVYQVDVFDQALFLFCGSRPDRFKALYWERDGFLLLYKRFENGRLQWPKNSAEIKKLNVQQLKRLLHGFSIEEKKTIHRSTIGAFH
jgi:Transposase and inactivated derivatives